MRRDELQDLLNCTRTLCSSSLFSLRMLRESPQTESYVLDGIARELSHRLIEHVDIQISDDPLREARKYDVRVTTVPAGAWLKIVSLLKEHVPTDG